MTDSCSHLEQNAAKREKLPRQREKTRRSADLTCYEDTATVYTLLNAFTTLVDLDPDVNLLIWQKTDHRSVDDMITESPGLDRESPLTLASYHEDDYFCQNFDQ